MFLYTHIMVLKLEDMCHESLFRPSQVSSTSHKQSTCMYILLTIIIIIIVIGTAYWLQCQREWTMTCMCYAVDMHMLHVCTWLCTCTCTCCFHTEFSIGDSAVLEDSSLPTTPPGPSYHPAVVDLPRFQRLVELGEGTEETRREEGDTPQTTTTGAQHNIRGTHVHVHVHAHMYYIVCIYMHICITVYMYTLYSCGFACVCTYMHIHVRNTLSS